MQLLRKWLRLGPEQQQLLLQAFLLVTISRLVLRLFPFPEAQRIVKAAGEWLTPRAGSHRESPAQVQWAIMAVTGTRLGGGSCLAQALAGQQMLACRGYEGVVRIGVAKTDDGGMLAHAWVECDGAVIVGGTRAELSRYKRLADLDEVFA